MAGQQSKRITALSIALEKGLDNIVQFLIEAGEV